MSVVFLNRTRRQGSKGVVGPVTLTEYNITPDGTPVSSHDADALLAMTEEPCCGQPLPFGGMVKSFGVHTPTVAQLEQVPFWLYDLEPVVKAKPARRRKTKKYSKPEPEPEPEDFGFLVTQTEELKEETSEEVS